MRPAARAAAARAASAAAAARACAARVACSLRLLGLGVGQPLELGRLLRLDLSGVCGLLGQEVVEVGLRRGRRGAGGLGLGQRVLGLVLELGDLGLDRLEVGLLRRGLGAGVLELLERVVGERGDLVGEDDAGREVVGAGRTQRDGHLRAASATLEEVGGEVVEDRLGLVELGLVGGLRLDCALLVGLRHRQLRGDLVVVLVRRVLGVLGLGQRRPARPAAATGSPGGRCRRWRGRRRSRRARPGCPGSAGRRPASGPPCRPPRTPPR